MRTLQPGEGACIPPTLQRKQPLRILRNRLNIGPCLAAARRLPKGDRHCRRHACVTVRRQQHQAERKSRQKWMHYSQ